MKWNSIRKRKQTEMRLEMTSDKKGGGKSNQQGRSERGQKSKA